MNSVVSENPSYIELFLNSDYLQTAKALQFIDNHCPGLNAIFQAKNKTFASNKYSMLYNWSKPTVSEWNDRPYLDTVEAGGVLFWSKSSLINEDAKMQDFIKLHCKNSPYFYKCSLFMKKALNTNVLSCASELLSDGFQGEVD